MSKENKPHIGIYGRCNAGKSTLLNLLLGEYHAIVSPLSGTTTDPVRRSFEILDFAPVMIIDTAGLDDNSLLGEKRKIKTLETLHQVDLAIVVVCGAWSSEDDTILNYIKNEGLDYIIIHNLYNNKPYKERAENIVESNLTTEQERDEIIEAIKKSLPAHSYQLYSMLGDKCSQNDVTLLICPIDSEAPAGRLILPQVQAIRDILDKKAISIVIQPEQISQFLTFNITPKIIVVDSQVIADVKHLLPINYHSKITTFSILLAEMKGDIELYKEGLERATTLKEGDKVLIMENCLHQTSCEDIGRIKIPQWLNQWRGCTLNYTILSGLTPLPVDLETYSLVVQCGGCMVTPRQLKSRIRRVNLRGVSITNYGMLIKKMKG